MLLVLIALPKLLRLEIGDSPPTKPHPLPLPTPLPTQLKEPLYEKWPLLEVSLT